MSLPVEVVIAPLSISDTTQEELQGLVKLINAVYKESEDGLWKKGWDLRRTNEEKFKDLVSKGEIIVARLNKTTQQKQQQQEEESQEEIVGCIHCNKVSEEGFEFGMLVVDPRFRRQGLGKRLIRHVEDCCRGEGARTMQLMLLHPKGWEQLPKQILKQWYPSLGYVECQELDFMKEYSAIASGLATECCFTMYKKDL